MFQKAMPNDPNMVQHRLQMVFKLSEHDCDIVTQPPRHNHNYLQISEKGVKLNATLVRQFDSNVCFHGMPSEAMELTASACGYEAMQDTFVLSRASETASDLFRLEPDDFLLRWLNFKLERDSKNHVSCLTELKGVSKTE